MTGREKYNIYCEMYKHLNILENNIKLSLENMGCKIHHVEVQVGKEETKQYMIYVEVTYPESGYKFHRGLYTKEDIKKVFKF